MPSSGVRFAGVFRTMAILLIALWAGTAAAQQNLLEKLKQGEANIVLMRHALAPGTGDPGNFTLGSCETQRNLNDVGRQQAEQTGSFLREHDLNFATVYTSQWCRCVETAELMQAGSSVVELPVINSFFQNMSKSSEQTRALQQWLSQQASNAPILLVTHQVNITAYTGVYPRSGELVVGNFNDAGEFTLLGRIDPR